MMALNFIQYTADGFALGVPAEGIFEPEIDMPAEFEACVDVGPDTTPVPGWNGKCIKHIVFIGVDPGIVTLSVEHSIPE